MFTKLLKNTALVAIYALAALPIAAQAQETRPTLTVAVQTNPPTQETVDPWSNVAYRNNPSVLETLIAIDFDKQGALGPNLALSWAWTDNQTLELKLRQGVIFHDGREMTADDVVFSFGPERMTGEKAPGRGVYLGYYATIDKVEAVDKYTVRFRTSRPDPVLPQRLASFGASIISKDAFQKAGGEWAKWTQKPVGTGAYKVESATPQQEVDLVAHDQYWGGKPKAAKVVFKVVPEVSGRIAGLIAGDYDIVTDLPPDQLSAVENTKGFKIVGGAVPNHRIIYFDKTNPALKDARVRQALILAIDRQTIVDTIWNKRIQVSRGLQFPMFDTYMPDYPEYRYAPEEAAKLLQDAGYKGEEIEYRAYNNYYTAEVPVAQALVAMWQAVGLNVKIKFIETGLFTPSATRGIGNWSYTAVVPDPYMSFYGQFGSKGNMTTQKIWTNDEFNAIGDKLAVETDPTARREEFRQALQIIDWKDPGATVLHGNAVFYGVRPGIDWKPMPSFTVNFDANHLNFTAAK